MPRRRVPVGVGHIGRRWRTISQDDGVHQRQARDALVRRKVLALAGDTIQSAVKGGERKAASDLDGGCAALGPAEQRDRCAVAAPAQRCRSGGMERAAEGAESRAASEHGAEPLSRGV
eukprot:5357736-Prymnesium_polylepis.1